ncbi:MAG: segregation/condensation protein A [Patescibacteria group bacterium]|nr:segregation/condensation protein A [Patescibacteria group bacterium]
MAYQVEIEQFQGPLDLLLKLIEEEELDISQVSLFKVTDQYLNYINQTDNITTGELVDFLMVAARLLYIKSKLILPDLDLNGDENDEDELALEKQLKIYRQYLEAAKKIDKILKTGQLAFSRTKINVKIQGFYPPKNVDLPKLKMAFESVLKNIQPIIKLPQRTLKKLISLQEKIKHIKEIILTQTKLKFSHLLAKEKLDTIVNFLAILELNKQGFIEVEQAEIFDEILIKRKK